MASPFPSAILPRVPNLTQLLAAHGGVLLLDAASSRVQVGALRAGAASVWRSSSEESGRAIFACAREVLDEVGWSVDDAPAFAYCEGPGSLLGIRTAVMALRTWLVLAPRPVFAFNSLDLLARGMARELSNRPCEIVADARREAWHAVAVELAGGTGPLRRVSSTELAGGSAPLLLPREFRRWAEPPRPATEVPYDVASLIARTADEPLFASVENPDVRASEGSDYRRWTARVHRAPA